MISFKCSASCGDIIYSLILVRFICESKQEQAVYYIHHNDGRYSNNRTVDTLQACKRLLDIQPYIKECLPYEGQKVEYDLDKFRRANSSFTNTPLPNRFFEGQGIATRTVFEPWLYVPEQKQKQFYVFNHTDRYNVHGVDWKKTLPANTMFIGLASEFEKHGEDCEGHIKTSDLLDTAIAIKQSRALYCNQSACLTIAQGMGHEVFLAKDRRFNNTVLGLEEVIS